MDDIKKVTGYFVHIPAKETRTTLHSIEEVKQ